MNFLHFFFYINSFLFFFFNSFLKAKFFFLLSGGVDSKFFLFFFSYFKNNFFLNSLYLFIDHKTKVSSFLEYDCLKSKCILLFSNIKYLKIISSCNSSENFLKNERYFYIYKFSLVKGSFFGFFFHHKNDVIENYFLNLLNKKNKNVNIKINMRNICFFYNRDDYFFKLRPNLFIDKFFFFFFLSIFKDNMFFIDYENFFHSKRYFIRENFYNNFNNFSYSNSILSYNSFLKKSLFKNNNLKKNLFLIGFCYFFFYFNNFFFFSLESFIKIIKFLFYQKKTFPLCSRSGFLYFISLIERFFYIKIKKKDVFFLIKFDNIKVYIFFNKIFINIY